MNFFFWKKTQKKPIQMEPTTGYPLYAPANGLMKHISDAPDPVFSNLLVGDGIYILPKENKIYAPADCNIAFIFPSRHALGLRTANDVELLLHIGFDPKKLRNFVFRWYVEEDQEVKKGTLLAEFDSKNANQRSISPPISLLVTNLSETQRIIYKENRNVTLEDIILEIQ